MNRLLPMFFTALAVLLAGCAGNPSVETRPAQLIDDRFLDHGDGTVTDNETGLMWSKCLIGQEWDGSGCVGKAPTFTREEAQRLANTLSTWRMPNIRELQSLVLCPDGTRPEYVHGENFNSGCPDPALSGPEINQEAFPFNSHSTYYIWSSTSPWGLSRSLGLFVNFGLGGVISHEHESARYHVYFVRKP